MLTRRENQVLELNATGLSAKEIADHISRSEFTVQKIICNLKEKIGLQKATELVAYYFCNRNGVDFREFKRQVLSAMMALLIFFSEYNKPEHVKHRYHRRTNTHVRLHKSRKRNEEFNTYNNV